MSITERETVANISPLSYVFYSHRGGPLCVSVCVQARVVLRPLRYDPFTGKGEGRWAAGLAEVRGSKIIS